MLKWFRKLLGRDTGPTVFAGYGSQIAVYVARHSDTPDLATLIVTIPGRTLEISWTPAQARDVAKSLFEAARDAQEGVPVEDVG